MAGTKIIILGFDGTWNTPDKNPEVDGDTDTNVRKFILALDKVNTEGKEQLSWYDEGVGTKWYDKVTGGAFGLGLSKNIMQAYEFLVKNHKDGDSIYILGFSRGAYSARSLVGMIRNSGLLRLQSIVDDDGEVGEQGRNLLSEAYELYRTRNDHADSENSKLFRMSYCKNPTPNIQFLGVWDTVGALGIPLNSFGHFNRNYFEFHDTELSGIVLNAFHALAIDENRQNFAPTLWMPKEKPFQHVEQTWFVGSHANIGGGYPESGLSNIALSWMMEKAEAFRKNGKGLKFLETNKLEANSVNFLSPIRDSYSEFGGGFFKLIQNRYFRKIGLTEFGNETVHKTVADRICRINAYRPKNEMGQQIKDQIYAELPKTAIA